MFMANATSYAQWDKIIQRVLNLCASSKEDETQPTIETFQLALSYAYASREYEQAPINVVPDGDCGLVFEVWNDETKEMQSVAFRGDRTIEGRRFKDYKLIESIDATYEQIRSTLWPYETGTPTA